MPNDFHADPRSDSQLDASSFSMRRALGILDGDKCPDMHAALMRASKSSSTALFGLVVNVISDDEMAEYDPQAEAFVEFAPPRMTLSERAMGRLKACDPRMRFTIFHELSHLWLNHRGKPRFRMVGRAERNEVFAAHTSGERQADVHAASGLMPTELVAGYTDAESIARDFGVSKAAAEVRLRQVQELSAKPTPPEVAEFLATFRAPVHNRQNSKGERHAAIDRRIEKAWNEAAIKPGLEAAVYRLCPSGNLVKRSEYMNHRSREGWCLKGESLRSYVDLGRFGFGEWHQKIYEDGPCRTCFAFTLVRSAFGVKCESCGRSSGDR